MTRTLLAGAVFVALVASPVARADYQSTVLSQGPAGYWRLNETLQPQNVAGAVNSGTLAGVLGTFNSYPSRGLTGPFAGSSAVGLDGSAQTITTPWQAGYNTTNFAVEMWVKPAQVPYSGTVSYVASSAQIASPRTGWYLAQDNGATFGAGSAFVVRLFYLNGTTQSLQLTAPVTNALGSWYHLVLTYDGTTATLYANGTVASSGTPTAYVPNLGAQFSIGMRSDVAFNWPGQVAEVAMYAGPLSAAQVSAHYTAATTTPAGYAAAVQADSPAIYYRFQEPIDPPAANSGTLGSAGDGLYIYNAKAGVAGPTSPAFPGFEAANKSVAFDAGGGVVRIPPLNLNTNTVTISGWINATNAQALGTGLILCGSGADASGLTIDQVNGGLGLGYIWNGNNYGISPTSDFGLPALPDSQWAYAALVIQPAEAALYICDANNFANFTSITNTFNVNHLNQAFAQATLVGAAAGYANRNFNGAIDEVTIFNRALGAGELYSQYATAVGGVPPRIFTDLQGPTDAVAVGDPIILTVDAGATPPVIYTWHRDSTTIATTTNIGVLTIASASLADNGNYDVTISNDSGSAPSQQVTVSVVNPSQPIITGLQGFIDRTLYPTGTLSLAVSATGGGLKYQWYKNSAPIPSATASTYTIARVTTVDAGSYSVSLTNSIGSASNGPVVITIPSVTTNSYEAAIISSGPEAWWRLDEAAGSTNMFDGMGRHDGTYTNAAGAGSLPTLGAAGALVANANTAASFTSAGQGIGLVPYSSDLNPPKFTIEAWVNTTVLDGQAPVSSSYGSDGWWVESIDGWWYGNSSGGFFGNNNNVNTEAAIVSGQWSHVVIEYDATRQSGGTFYPFTLYVNGETDGFIWGAPPANIGGPFIIGGRGVSASTLADRFFDGKVDEVAVYKRLLSVAEIQAHFTARGVVVIPPSFAEPLLSQTVTTGKNVRFSTSVLGTAPISLQWYKDGAPVTDKTNAYYGIASTAMADAGTYTLWATNAVGTNSLSATLAVIAPAGYANVTNDLVLHLRFDSDTTDSSGRGNNGTSSPTAPGFVPGIIGSQALQYITETTTGGSGGTVTNASFVTLGAVASGPPADLRFGAATSFTVGLWVKLAAGAQPGDLPFIGTETNAANNPGWILCPSYGGGGWQWNLNDGANNLGVNGADNSINDGDWHHFVLSVDRAGAVADSYLDGVRTASRSISSLGSIDNNNHWPIVIGQDPTGLYAESGSATLDDVAIWRRALTALEVATIESAGSTAGRSFDTVGSPQVTLTITPSAGNLVINYASGTLQQSSTLGPSADWQPVPGASAPSHTVTPTGAAMYFRVLVQ